MMWPGPKRLKFSSGINVVFDGNSLVSGVGSTGGNNFPTQVAAQLPILGSGTTTVNCGISGQTWRQMNGLDGGSSSDVDNAWVNGKKNVLVLWETTNSVYNTARTGAQAASDGRDYVKARQAIHPWTVVLLTTLPRQDPTNTQSTTNSLNAELVAADVIMRANYREWGAHAIVDLRAVISELNQPDYTPASFGAFPALWADNPHIHLTNAGYALVAKAVSNRLRQLPG